MKKTVKFLAVFALCFSVLANCLPTYAAAPATITCGTCGKTANWRNSEEKAGWNITSHIVEATGKTCYVGTRAYEDTYVCGGCGRLIRTTHTENNVHSISHD